ncbi:MAG: hypothetical protein NTU91_13855 [Chloroflexi bacterium]|jgi:hypothetical protein|nr:hypothetical protein [Chloroflexota bacterium]
MPSVIDPETMHVDSLPVVWSPVQSPLTEEERAREVEEQATASLLWAADAPETILRLLLGEDGHRPCLCAADGLRTGPAGRMGSATGHVLLRPGHPPAV